MVAVALSCGWVTAAHDAPAQGHKAPAAHGKKPHPKPESKPPKRPPATAPTVRMPVARAPADAADLQAPTAAPLDLRAEVITLNNDLRVVLSPDHRLPSLAVAVAYGAGSGREAVGQQGIARVVAAAMSAGPSRDLGAGELQRLVRSEGGSTSALVDREVTLFVDVLPAGALAFGLWLEASRMNLVDINESTLTTSPGIAPPPAQSMAEARARLEELAFQGFWPYEHRDRVAFTDRAKAVSAARDFHRAWYTPANTVVAIAGNFDPDEAIRLAHDMFDGAIGNQPPVSDATAALPDQTSERSARIDVGPADAQGLIEGWTAPALGQEGHAALAVAAVLLNDRLDLGQQTHADRLRQLSPGTKVDVEMGTRLGHALWTVSLTVPPGVDLDKERAVVDNAIDELGRLGPTPDELRAAWADAELDFLQGVDSLGERAAALARAEANRGDLRLLRNMPVALLHVTRDDVRKAVARTLTPARRNLVELAGPKAPPPAHAAVAPVTPPAPEPRAARNGHGKHTAKPAKKKTGSPPAAKKKEGKPAQHGGKRP